MPVRVVDERKRREPAVDVEALRTQCVQALALAGLSHNCFGLALIDDARMSDYNRQYRGKEGPTNVLSFPAAHRDAVEAAPPPPPCWPTWATCSFPWTRRRGRPKPKTCRSNGGWPN